MKDFIELSAETPEVSITIPDAPQEAESSESPVMEIKFQPDTLNETLPMMGKGMLGIFIVIAVIIAIVCVLNRVTRPKEKQE